MTFAVSGAELFPAAGVTVAALLLLPRRLWALALSAVFASELAADLLLGEAIATAAGSAIAVISGPTAGVSLALAGSGRPLVLSRQRHLVAFVLGPVLTGAGISAVIGATASLLSHPHHPFAVVLARWWTSSALSVLIVGALAVAWLSRVTWPVLTRPRWMEACWLGSSAVILTWVAFWRWQPGLIYLCLLPLAWAAIRFGLRGTTAVAALMAVLSEWGTVAGHGLFVTVSSSHTEALWLVQLFVAVAVLGGLMLESQVTESRIAGHAAQTAERAKLARDLHDSVSQVLFSMAMHARAAQLALTKLPVSDDGHLTKAVTQVRELAGLALAELRTLIFDLRQETLAKEGLVAALTRQADVISVREQLPVAVRGPAVPVPLPDDVAEQAYRIALEALHNVVKHAGATQAAICVAVTEAGLLVTITDDGRGFDTARARPGHLGLLGMAERARAIGADLTVISAPGAGTCVQLVLPVDSERVARSTEARDAGHDR